MNIFAKIPISITTYIKLCAIEGVSHLWFIKAILLCYLLTPILQLLREKSLYITILLLVSGILYFILICRFQDLFSWIWLYALGYYFPLLELKIRKILVVVYLLITLLLTYFSLLELHERLIINLWHYYGGLFFCFSGIIVLRYITSKVKFPYVIKILDKYSFYIYITHHIYLLGPFSIKPFISNISLCFLSEIVLILISVAIFDILMKNCEKIIYFIEKNIIHHI